jgi:DNA-directed RNA polymerase subunit alpha
MHLRWRGLDLPANVFPEPKSRTATFSRFTAEPFEPGFGTTIGNCLRRVLLSSIEGAAITKVKIKGVNHEFSTIPGVLEDVVDIILNIKGIVVAINPDKVIATLTDKIDFDIEFTVEKGRGYMPASEQISKEATRGGDQVIGEIPIDAIFSPVQRVRFATEDTRVGQQTNYQKLTLDVWTNGTVTPDMALVEAAKILRKHLNPFVQFDEIGDHVVSDEVAASNEQDDEIIRKLRMPVTELELSVRASNCLETAKIRSVGELVQRTEDELLGVRSFGKTSLREVKSELEKIGLHLGYPVPDGVLNA